MEKTAFDNIVDRFGYMSVNIDGNKCYIKDYSLGDLSQLSVVLKTLATIPKQNMPQDIKSKDVIAEFEAANKQYHGYEQDVRLRFDRVQQSGWNFGIVNFNNQRGDLLDITYQNLNRFGNFGQAVCEVIKDLEDQKENDGTLKLCRLALIATQFSLLPCARKLISFTCEHLQRCENKCVLPLGQAGVTSRI